MEELRRDAKRYPWERTRKNADYSRGEAIIQAGETRQSMAVCWRLFEEQGIR
jgi:hypothetical protein